MEYMFVDFLQIKHNPSEPVYSFIQRFEKQRLRTKDIGFEPNDVTTRGLLDASDDQLFRLLVSLSHEIHVRRLDCDSLYF
jgi:hypothetical protein